MVSTEPWDKLYNEPQDDYLLFQEWLHSPKRRLTSASGDLAKRWNWAGRALAYDRSSVAPADLPARLAQIHKNLASTVYFESAKLLERSQRTDASQLNPREMVSLLAYLAEHQDVLKDLLGSDEEQADLTKLSDEQYKKLKSLYTDIRKKNTA